MSVAEAPPAARPARPVRPRPPLIAALRLLLPALAVGLTLLVIGWAVVGALLGAGRETSAVAPMAITSPRLVGQDDKQRPYAITAVSATRDASMSARIHLDHPVLVRDQGGADNLHVTAAKGVYDEAAGRLELTGGVQITGSRGEFTAPTAVYDTKTGTVLGQAGVQGAGDLGQMRAGSFTVKDKGKSVIYQGGVHTRINPK